MTLVFGVRSLEKGNAAKLQIEQTTHCKSSFIQLVQLDMSNFDSIEKFVKGVKGKFKKFDIVVLNASVAARAYNLSVHGWEMLL